MHPAQPLPDDDRRLALMGERSCSYVLHEERFDRITRTVRRLLDVPIALISMVEKEEQWLRSVQGLEIGSTPRDVSFCGHAIVQDAPLCVNDTLQDERFADNPLVTGPPYFRAYLGWPLQVAPGVRAGTLCALDTMPRTFGPCEFDALQDLAAMVVAELKLDIRGRVAQRFASSFDAVQRRLMLDPLTGCMNHRGLREYLAMCLAERDMDGSKVAVAAVQVRNFDALSAQWGEVDGSPLSRAIAQGLRRLVAPDVILARLTRDQFCAVVQRDSAIEKEAVLQRISQPVLDLPVATGSGQVSAQLSWGMARLSEFDRVPTPDLLWTRAVARLGQPSPYCAARLAKRVKSAAAS
jgi:GGDEF domain-containing protein